MAEHGMTLLTILAGIPDACLVRISRYAAGTSAPECTTRTLSTPPAVAHWGCIADERERERGEREREKREREFTCMCVCVCVCVCVRERERERERTEKKCPMSLRAIIAYRACILCFLTILSAGGGSTFQGECIRQAPHEGCCVVQWRRGLRAGP